MDLATRDLASGPAVNPPPVDRIGVALGWIALAALTYLVYRVLAPFLVPLGWAAVLAIAVYPAHAWFERRWGATWAAVTITLGVAVILVMPALIVMTIFAGEAIEAGGSIQRALVEGRLAWVERTWSELGQRFPIAARVDVETTVADAARRAAAFLVAQSGSILRDAARTLFNLVVALFATFFLLRDSRVVVRTVRRILPMHEAAREELIRRTIELVSVGVTSSVIVAAVQGTLGGLVFWAVGINAAVFWGVVMGLLCLLPFGAWVVWLPAAVLLAAAGDVTRAIMLAVLGFAIVSASDNFLRPMLVSGRAHINGLVILVGLLGGMSVFGALGLVLGPVLVATALALLGAYVDAPARDPWRA